MDDQEETLVATAVPGQQPTVPLQLTGQAGQALLIEGDSDSDEGTDPGLTDNSSEDDDSG